MEHAFVLPFPKFRGSTTTVISDPYENDTEKNALLQFWRGQLDKLAEKKITWEAFFSLLPKEFWTLTEHPAFEAATTKEGHGLLHLAIYQHRDDLVPALSEVALLRLRRNSYGLTPGELAAYLNRSKSAPFLSQPNVEVEDEKVIQDLSSLEYLSHPIYESEEALNQILSRTKKAKATDSIPPEKIWMGIYFDKEVQNGLHPKVAIRWIDEEIGFGVFASQRIPSCSFVGEYTGVVQERRKKHLKGNYYCVRCTTWEMGRKKYVIDAEKKGNFTRFINHSAKPNLGLQSIYWRGLPRMVFISLKEIPEGAQLTFDYGNFFWKECRQTPKLF